MPKLRGRLPSLAGGVLEKEFEIIVPNVDNSDEPVRMDKVHEELSEELTQRFGGVTIYDEIGCEIPEEDDSEEDMHCEPVTIFSFTRDWDDPNTEEQLTSNSDLSRLELLEEDREFVKKKAEAIAENLGQFGVFTDEDNVDAELVIESREDRAEPDYRAREMQSLKDILTPEVDYNQS